MLYCEMRLALNTAGRMRNPSEPNAGLMLVQRHRRWVNIKPTLVQRFGFAGNTLRRLSVGVNLRRRN